MKKIRIFFFCLLFVFISSLVHAKVNVSGFVILNNGDTLKGKITIRVYIDIPILTDLFHEVTFLQDNKKKIRYYPKDLKGFGLEVDSVYLYFVSKKVSKRLLPYGETEIFLRIVEKGYLSLFEFQTDDDKTLGRFYIEYLIQKEEEDLFFLDSGYIWENMIKYLEKFFGDETELFQRMKNARKLYSKIPQFTKEYNQKKRDKNNTK